MSLRDLVPPPLSRYIPPPLSPFPPMVMIDRRSWRYEDVEAVEATVAAVMAAMAAA